MSKQQYLTIKALTAYIKRKFEYDPHLKDIYVKGEISNFNKHHSGHMYFNLKDEHSLIPVTMFARENRQLTFIPEEGMSVTARGRVSVYEPHGEYRLYLEEMNEDGLGNLYLAYEKLKKKLLKEGLFSDEKKRPIPKIPKRIGVVTSKTGAVIRDIITTIERRFPICEIVLFPTTVQGDKAPQSIVQSIDKANQFEKNIDLLIVGRGGGSIEDLWAFNDEKVARAIFNSKIPVISAVGHETDTTIADFVADLRAPTPTAAAELAVPHIGDLLEKVTANETRLRRLLTDKITNSRERLSRIEKSYAFRYPHLLYEEKLEQVDKLTEQLYRNSKRLYSNYEQQLRDINHRLLQIKPEQLLKRNEEQLQSLTNSLKKAIHIVYSHKEKDFQMYISTLEALNPLKIMDRGYSVVYDENDLLVKSVKKVKKDDELNINLIDGKIVCEVLKVEGSESNGS